MTTKWVLLKYDTQKSNGHHGYRFRNPNLSPSYTFSEQFTNPKKIYIYVNIMYDLNPAVPSPTEKSNDHIENRIRELCHEDQPTGNPIDFNTIPTERLFDYRTVCYDLQHVMNYFNFNWIKPNFCFTIDRMHCASFQTMKELAERVTSYNMSIDEGLDWPQFTYYIGDKSYIGESIKMDNLMELLIFDLCNDNSTALCKEIITYDDTRPKNLVIMLKVLYLFSNTYSFESVKPFYQRFFPHIVSKVESKHPYLIALINKMYKFIINGRRFSYSKGVL